MLIRSGKKKFNLSAADVLFHLVYHSERESHETFVVRADKLWRDKNEKI